MGFDVLTVELQSSAPVFFSGQQIHGHVRVVASSEVSCRELNLVCRGKGKVHWTEHRNKRTYTYEAKENYGLQSLILWKGETSGNKFPPGNHSFPFMFVLPPGIPSSFETTHGKVHYEVKATADIPWGLDHVERAFFNVHNMYDLNLDESAMRPVTVQEEGTSGCCCCKQGPISFEISTERRGYVPGEKMHMNGVIWNHTVSPIKYTEAKIVQKITLHATSKTKEEKTTVQRVYRPSIRAGGKDVWNSVPLTVPAVSASKLQNCNIIDIEYELKFLAKIGMCKSPTVGTELIIGSVPFRGTPAYNIVPSGGEHVMQPPPMIHHQPIMHPPAMPSAPMAQQYGMRDAPPPYPESEPPTYEASKNYAGPDDDEGGFAPRPHEKNYAPTYNY